MTITSPSALLALAEATPDSLSIVMERFPPSPDDLESIVRYFREKKAQWIQDEAAGKTRASAPKEPKPPRAAKAKTSKTAPTPVDPTLPLLSATDFADEI